MVAGIPVENAAEQQGDPAGAVGTVSRQPYLLPASFEPMNRRSYVRKPMLSREGANVSSDRRRQGGR